MHIETRNLRFPNYAGDPIIEQVCVIGADNKILASYERWISGASIYYSDLDALKILQDAGYEKTTEGEICPDSPSWRISPSGERID